MKQIDLKTCSDILISIVILQILRLLIHRRSPACFSHRFKMLSPPRRIEPDIWTYHWAGVSILVWLLSPDHMITLDHVRLWSSYLKSFDAVYDHTIRGFAGLVSTQSKITYKLVITNIGEHVNQKSNEYRISYLKWWSRNQVFTDHMNHMNCGSRE